MVKAAILALLAFVGLSLGSTALGYGWAWFAAPWQGRLEARQQIESGPSRIVNTNYFFNQCAAVRSAEDRIDTLRDELTAAKDSSDIHRIQTNLSAARIGRAEAIRDYNAKAANDYTSAQFQSAKLPYQLPSGEYRPGVKTLCAD